MGLGTHAAAVALLGRAYRIITGMLPPRLAASIDYLRPGLRLAVLGEGPLNGQVQRQQAIRRLVAAIPFDEIIETGTFRGISTEFFAALSGVPVYSAESNLRLVEFARRRLAMWPTVRVEFTDSRAMLRRLSQRPDVREKTALFYLDAHWDRDLPLRDEIQIVVRAWEQAVVVIDDFQVPGDSGYAFDDYGPGMRLDTSYLPMDSLAGWGLFFPAAASVTETGARRGWAMLVSPSLLSVVASISDFRRA